MVRISKFWVLLVLVSSVQLVHAQARDTIAIMRTRYNTFQTQAKPTGDTKAKFDALDADIARAARLGRTGELRRLYTQGIALAQNRPWNADIEFASSLALQTATFVDPGAPAPFRLAQIYTPSLELSEPLSMRVTLRKPEANAEKLKDAGTFTNLSRDLIESFPVQCRLLRNRRPGGCPRGTARERTLSRRHDADHGSPQRTPRPLEPA